MGRRNHFPGAFEAQRAQGKESFHEERREVKSASGITLQIRQCGVVVKSIGFGPERPKLDVIHNL